MNDVSRPPTPVHPRARARSRDPLAAPVDLADPAAVRAWAEKVGATVALLRPLAEDATAQKGQRVRSRRYLRNRICWRIRDLDALVSAVTPTVALYVPPEQLDVDRERAG
jgi:hypothetical protein